MKGKTGLKLLCGSGGMESGLSDFSVPLQAISYKVFLSLSRPFLERVAV